MVFAEALTEYLMDGLSEALAKADEPTPPVPLVADRYVALSTLQKAIRRGHEELALRAAMNLMIGGPHAIWRRLGMIGFEDVGVANIDLAGWVTVVIGKPEVRKRPGGEWKVADFLIRTLCRSAKCRAATRWCTTGKRYNLSAYAEWPPIAELQRVPPFSQQWWITPNSMSPMGHKYAFSAPLN